MRGLTKALSALPLMAVFGASACVSTIEQKPDKPEPNPEVGVADFSALFDDRTVSFSVYPSVTSSKDRASYSKVLLSPNVVFESSRSSMDEDKVHGPAGAEEPEPSLFDALGRPISVPLSSALVAYLMKRGTTLITPSAEIAWQKAKGTWLERLLSAYAGMSEEGRPEVAFGVRELGVRTVLVDVTATYNKDQTLVFRPRSSPDEPSVCGEMALPVPSIVFSAELISAKDGALLARIHEQRTPEVDVAQHASIDLVRWEAVRRKAYTQVKWGEPVAESQYSYVTRWRKRDIYCEEALSAYEKIVDRVARETEDTADETAATMLRESLDRLYK